MQTFDAITFGGAMVDTIACIDDQRIEQMSMSNAGKSYLLLEQGSKTEALTMSSYCGGGAVNAAVSLARLGFRVASCVKLGRDDRGKFVLQTLGAEGVDTSAVVWSEDVETGASAIIAAHERNAAIFTYRGANTTLNAPIDLPKAVSARWFHVCSLSGASAEALPAILAFAARSQARTVVNPGVRQIAGHFDILQTAFPSIDMLAVNQLEAETIVEQSDIHSGRAGDSRLRGQAQSSNPPTENTLRELSRRIRDLGAPAILITAGRHGACYASASGFEFSHSVSATVASTAGAGDAFVSTFAGYFFQGHSVETSLRAAAINSASVVSKIDAQSGLLHRRCLDETLHDFEDRSCGRRNLEL